MSLFEDLLHTHLGRALHDIPGEPWLENFAGKFAGNLIQSVEQAPGGLYYLGKTALFDPEKLPGIGVQMARQTLTDLEHPLRRPGYTALDLLGILGGAGAIAGRVGEAGAIASRGGALPDALAGLTSEEAAAQLGRGAQYDRIVNKTTGQVRPVGYQIKEALLHGPAQQERLLQVPGSEPSDLVHGWMYSKNPAIKAAQQLVDKAYDTHPEHNVPPAWRVLRLVSPRSQTSRISSARKAEELIVGKESKAEAARLKALYGDSPDAWHMAIRLIGEGTTPEALLHRHQEILSTGALGPKLLNETRARMPVIEEAKQFLDERTIVDTAKDKDGNEIGTGVARTIPVLKADAPKELHDYLEAARTISEKRSWASRMAGILNSESEVRRLVGPYTVVHGGVIHEALTRLRRQLGQYERADFYRPEKARAIREEIAKIEQKNQLSLDELMSGEFDPTDVRVFTGHEEAKRFAEAAGLFRVPYKIERDKGLGRIFAGTARKAYGGGKPRVPSTYTHPFKGEILKGGGGDPNVANLLAESYTEAHRFLALKSVYAKLLLSAQDTPEGIPEGHARLIRTEETLSEHIPIEKARRLALSKPPTDKMFEAENLTPEEAVAAGRLYEGIRRNLFPETEAVAAHLRSLGDYTLRQIDAMLGKHEGEYQKVPGYKWIDDRLLGGLEKKNPLYGLYDNKLATRFIRGVDTVNSLLKGVMLYMRPAYAVPNMLGNVALSLIHGGLLSPVHMAHSLMVWRKMPLADKKSMLEQMGEGTGAIAFERGNRVAATSAKIGRFYSKFVDQPFRINAFLLEARRNGFSTAHEVHELLTNPDNGEALGRVTNVANDAIINYERMGPGEEAVLRRLVLFYPFMKGATRYANYFYKNHPVAAGLSGGLGTIGEQRSEELLGNLPVYMAGLIPYTGGARPLTGNPQSFGILTEPADLALQIMNLVKGNPNKDLALTNNLSWAEGAILSALSGGKVSTIAHQPSEPAVETAWNQLVGGLPPITLYNRLTGKGATGGPLNMSVYPDPSKLDALLTFFFTGGLSPRLTDKYRANYRAWQEAHPR